MGSTCSNCTLKAQKQKLGAALQYTTLVHATSSLATANAKRLKLAMIRPAIAFADAAVVAFSLNWINSFLA